MNSLYQKQVCDLFGWTVEEFEAIYTVTPVRGIRINTLKSNLAEVQAGFDFALQSAPFYKDSYYIPSDTEGIGNYPLHHAGGYYVQEPSAASVLTAVDAQSGERILDLCAAPGGKSTGIAAGIGESGLLWSNEYIRKRAAALLSNIERMGITNAAVSSLSADYLCKELAGFFDAVVVDAPCSGEGMWRHNPQVEAQWSPAYVAECAALQQEILSAAAEAVRPGGRLIYSTCTFNRQENEDNVILFLKNHSDFTLESIPGDFGMAGCSGDASIDAMVRRITPKQGGEGHFIARFHKAGMGNAAPVSMVSESISAEHKKIVTAFLLDNFQQMPEGVLMEKGDLIYLVPAWMPLVRGDILRYGLLVGEIRKNRLEPAHALFTAAGLQPKRRLELALDDERLVRFLKGEEIPMEGEKGYTAITVAGCPLGFGKCSGNRLTNRYPKGLRLL